MDARQRQIIGQLPPHHRVEALRCGHETAYLGRWRFGGQEFPHDAAELLLLIGERELHRDSLAGSIKYPLAAGKDQIKHQSEQRHARGDVEY